MASIQWLLEIYARFKIMIQKETFQQKKKTKKKKEKKRKKEKNKMKKKINRSRRRGMVLTIIIIIIIFFLTQEHDNRLLRSISHRVQFLPPGLEMKWTIWNRSCLQLLLLFAINGNLNLYKNFENNKIQISKEWWSCIKYPFEEQN